MFTFWDEQDGKLLTGYVVNRNEFFFTLLDPEGNELGRFDSSYFKN